MNKAAAFITSAAGILLAGYSCNTETSAPTTLPTGAPSSTRSDVGSLRFNLEIAPDVSISAIDYRITAADIPTAIEGTIPLGSHPRTTSGTTFTAIVDGVPVGTGRQIALQGTASDGAVCAGQGTFDVLADASTSVSVVLECRDQSGSVIVHGTFDRCPLITAMSVAPDTTPVGGRLAVSAAASDPEGQKIILTWTSDTGRFANPFIAQTSYICRTPGAHTLTATVRETDGSCKDSFGVDVTCTELADAGADAALSRH